MTATTNTTATNREQSRQAQSRLTRAGYWLSIALMIVLAISWAVPVIWALIASFRLPNNPMGRDDVWFSSAPTDSNTWSVAITLENYHDVTSLAPFDQYYVTTIIVVTLILAVQFVTVTLAAFAFAHYQFRGKKHLFFFILLQMMIPTTALLVPNFSTIRTLNLYDTRLAIAIPYFGSAFGTFLMRQAFLEVPRDLVDAGTIDGCRWWQLLRNIYLPPAIPTLIAFALSSVSWHRNELLWPLIITQKESVRPLTFGLVRFTQLGEIGAQWSLLTAATLIVAAPLLIAFLVFQRRFIQSFLHSGIK